MSPRKPTPTAGSRPTTRLRRRGATTTALAPIEVEALLQTPVEPAEAGSAATVQMVPLTDPAFARGSDALPVVDPPPVRGPRRPRTTLRVEEIKRKR